MRVIGIGNPLRGDDAVGLLVARRVRELGGPRVEVLELEGEPGRLIDAWQGARLAVVVDAVRAGAREGSVMRFDASATALPASISASSTHALGLGDAIEIARALDRLPPRLVVYGVEGASFGAGEAVSEPVAAAVDEAARAVLRERCAARLDTFAGMERSYIGPAFGEAKVHDAMRVGVVSCRPETKLADVARMMAGYDIHSVVVLDVKGGGGLWGIVTSLDLARAAGDLGSLTAGEVASTDLVTVASNEPLKRAAELMAEHRITHLIAVQPESGRPAGMISARGIAAALAYGS